MIQQINKITFECIENVNALYERAYEMIRDEVQGSAKTMGLATGGTMMPLYERIVQSDLDFHHMVSFNLDEYVGLPKTHPESYIVFMNRNLFEKKPFQQSFLPDGEAQDVHAECENYEKLMEQHGLDFQLLGVGENGHIGFNEPGTSFESVTHLVELTASTREANARFFDSIEQVPTHAVTMGIASILRAKSILLIAIGEKKRFALEALLKGELDENVPVTALLKHNHVHILTDLKL